MSSTLQNETKRCRSVVWILPPAQEVFEGMHFTGQDSRINYTEDRFITVGFLDARLIVLVWTPRGKVRRIISMRKANDREKALYARALD